MIKINYEKCLKCNMCVLACKRGLINAGENGCAPKAAADGSNECFECWHCVSVCPNGAIEFESADPVEFGEPLANNFEYESFLKFIRSRRSCRNYKKQPVPGELISRVINAARYAPTAKNSQGVNVCVVTGDKLNKLAELTFEFYKELINMIANPVKKIFFRLAVGAHVASMVEKNRPSFEYGYKMWLDGIDLLFYDAPSIIVTHASKNSAMPKDDCDYALLTMSFTAETLGLASCINGFLSRAAERSQNIRRFLKIPEGNLVYNAMTLGYPALKYKKTPARKRINVSYIN